MDLKDLMNMADLLETQQGVEEMERAMGSLGTTSVQILGGVLKGIAAEPEVVEATAKDAIVVLKAIMSAVSEADELHSMIAASSAKMLAAYQRHGFSRQEAMDLMGNLYAKIGNLAKKAK